MGDCENLLAYSVFSRKNMKATTSPIADRMQKL